MARHDETDPSRRREHERPIEQHVGRYGNQDLGAMDGIDDRCPRRERIRGRSRRGRNDHPIGHVRSEEFVVEQDFDSDRVTQLGPFEQDLVQRRLQFVGFCATPMHLGADPHALLHGVPASEEPLDRGPGPSGLDGGEIAQLSDVHAEHGHLGLSRQRHRTEHRAVAADSHDQIEPTRELVLGYAQIRPTDQLRILSE